MCCRVVHYYNSYHTSLIMANESSEDASLVDIEEGGNLRKLQLSELEEIRKDAYDNTRIHQSRTVTPRKL